MTEDKSEDIKGLKTILIVEDDTDLLSMLSKRFKKLGYAVIPAASVETALELIRKSLPDMILLDLGFKGASGHALIRDLDKHDKISTPPVLVMSGYSDPEIVEFFLSLGASDFISKPFQFSEVAGKVEALIH